MSDEATFIIERIVTRLVETHALRCGVSEIETWAQRWLSGDDRSADSAWLAVEMARVLAAAAAAWAAEDADAGDAVVAVDAAVTEWAAETAAEAWTAAAVAWAASVGAAVVDVERDAQIADMLAVLGGEK